MNTPTRIRVGLSNRPLWYDTNIPLPTEDADLFLFLLRYWDDRWYGLAKKQHKMSEAEWIHYRMIYSRLAEFNNKANEILC
jgi:hypothetical protein